MAKVTSPEAQINPELFKLLLIRRARMSFGTYGEITMPDGQILTTTERPWLLNARGISCIPEGEYQCVSRMYHRGGYEAIAILAVPGRSHILFHVANTPSDVRGCIGIGEAFGFVKGAWAVTNSRLSFKEFMRQMSAAPFTLVISTGE